MAQIAKRLRQAWSRANGRVVEGDRLVVLGIASARHYPILAVRTAVQDARRVRRTLHPLGHEPQGVIVP